MTKWCRECKTIQNQFSNTVNNGSVYTITFQINLIKTGNVNKFIAFI